VAAHESIEKRPTFALFYDNFFSILQFHFKPTVWPSGCGGLFVQFVPETSAITLMLPEPERDLLSEPTRYSDHPYVLPARRLNSTWADGVVDASGRALFPSHIAQLMEKRRERDAAFDHFLARLQDIGLGSVKIDASNQSGYAMKAISDDLY
jgi:hypothetical protein